MKRKQSYYLDGNTHQELSTDIIPFKVYFLESMEIASYKMFPTSDKFLAYRHYFNVLSGSELENVKNYLHDCEMLRHTIPPETMFNTDMMIAIYEHPESYKLYIEQTEQKMNDLLVDIGVPEHMVEDIKQGLFYRENSQAALYFKSHLDLLAVVTYLKARYKL